MKSLVQIDGSKKDRFKKTGKKLWVEIVGLK